MFYFRNKKFVRR